MDLAQNELQLMNLCYSNSWHSGSHDVVGWQRQEEMEVGEVGPQGMEEGGSSTRVTKEGTEGDGLG